MAAPKGNQFWKARASSGRKPIFEDEDQLWDMCCEYFQWIENNPFIKETPFAYMGEVTDTHKTEIPRAMTIQGLCAFLDISDETWHKYRKQDDFSGICSTVDRIIFEQKFTGAAAGLLNPAIIARELGLADKKDLTSSDGSMTPKGMDSFYADDEGDGE